MLAPTEIRGGHVKHQYVGDINDYRKYALLRALSAGGANRIGVCWMLTPDDGGTHGGKTDWGEELGRFDQPLSDFLQSINRDPKRRNLWSIERSGIIPGAMFYGEDLPQSVGERSVYMAACRAKFADADLVFFDPDNGIAPPGTKPGQTTTLHVSLDEAAAFYGEGKSVLLYQHRPKLQTWEALIASKVEQLRTAIPDAAIWVFWRADVAFFLLVHPESPARLAIAAMEACRTLDPSFVRGKYLARASPPAG